MKDLKNLAAEIEAETIGGLLFTGLLFLAFTVHFLILSQDHLPGDGTNHGGLGPHISIISEDNAPQACPQANLVGAFFQVRFSLPKCPWLESS